MGWVSYREDDLERYYEAISKGKSLCEQLQRTIPVGSHGLAEAKAILGALEEVEKSLQPFLEFVTDPRNQTTLEKVYAWYRELILIDRNAALEDQVHKADLKVDSAVTKLRAENRKISDELRVQKVENKRIKDENKELAARMQKLFQNNPAAMYDMYPPKNPHKED